MNDLQVVAGRWTSYEIREGCIRPAAGARLQAYDPWRTWPTRPPARSSSQQKLHVTPHQALLSLLNELRYRQPKEQPPDFEPQAFDLTPPLSDASETKILAWCARYGLLGILPHRVLQATLAPQAGLQLQYTKIGAGWIVAERTAVEHVSRPTGALLQPLRGTGPAAEPLSGTWSRFFPAVPREQHETFPIRNRSRRISGRSTPSP